MRRGAWLGIDVGSSKAKVLTFCLITSDAEGGLRVAFERGSARCDSDIEPWPANKAHAFTNLDSAEWISNAAKVGIRRILTSSVVVPKWLALARDRALVVGAAVHVGVDKQRLIAEGAIIAPASQPAT